MRVYINGIGNISPQDTFGTREFPVLSDMEALTIREVLPPNYKDWIDPRMLRRMSKILKMGVSAAGAALRDGQLEMPEAIVTATALGCTQDTHRFLCDLIEREEQALSPTSFIQSTHNTIGGQIALQRQLHGYNMTYTQRGSSFESALLDAMLLIDGGQVSNALVGGIDELIEPVEMLQRRMGLYRQLPSTSVDLSEQKLRGSIGGEGAAFFVLGSQPKNAYGCLYDVESVFAPDGNEAVMALKNMLERNQLELTDIDLIVSGRSGDAKGDGLYDRVFSELEWKGPEAIFKYYSGEFQTASGFGLWLGAMALFHNNLPQDYLHSGATGTIDRILIYNHFQGRNHNFILLGR